MKSVLVLLTVFAVTILLSSRYPHAPQETEQAAIQRRLPGGCVFVDLGTYKSIDNVVAVICDGRKAQTTTSVDFRQSGKMNVAHNAVAVEVQP